MTPSGSILTNEGKGIILERAYTASPTRTVPTQFKVGINSNTPNIVDIDLTSPVPISDGTVVHDCSGTFGGTLGGDDTTAGTATYKEGAGTTDNTSQNLLTNTSSGTKFWSGTVANNVNGAQDASAWLYIKDSTTLNKFETAGTAVKVWYGSNSSNYYSSHHLQTALSTGWNYLRSGTKVNSLAMTGSVDGVMDNVGLQIVTTQASDSFSSGDVILDLFRQWQDSDLTKNWLSGTYPNVNTSTFIAEMRGELLPTEANGFDIDSFGDFNVDSPIKLSGEDSFTSESKSKTDKFTFVVQDHLL